MSGRVINSGYIPPVSSKRARRNNPSELRSGVNTGGHQNLKVTHILNRSATPGRNQTGSTAALLQASSTPGSALLSV